MNSANSIKFHFNLARMSEKLNSAIRDVVRGNYFTIFSDYYCYSAI